MIKDVDIQRFYDGPHHQYKRAIVVSRADA